jgi:hypothetical protein
VRHCDRTVNIVDLGLRLLPHSPVFEIASVLVRLGSHSEHHPKRGIKAQLSDHKMIIQTFAE